MNRRQKIIVSVTGIFLVLLILVGLTYAYFLTRIDGNGAEKSISVTTKNLHLTYSDGNGILTPAEAIVPGNQIKFKSGETVTTEKTFSVINNGDDTEYVVFIDDVSVTYANNVGESIKQGDPTSFESNDFRFTLNCTIISSDVTRNNTSCNGTENSVFPLINESILVGNDIIKGDTHNYTLTMEYLETGRNQSNDMNKSLSALINIEDVNRLNPYKDNTDSLAYNIINNAKNKTNGTQLVATPDTRVVKDPAIYKEPLVLNISNGGFSPKLYETYDAATIGQPHIEDAGIPYTSCDDSIKGMYLYDFTNMTITGPITGCDENGNVIAMDYGDKYESSLSIEQDDLGSTYYYRGDVKDNYVSFAGMCWRIVRIEGDGSIKLILEDKDQTCSKNMVGNWAIPTTTNGNVFKGNYGYSGTTSSNNLNYLHPQTNVESSMSYAFKNFQTTFSDSELEKMKIGNWCMDDTAYLENELLTEEEKASETSYIFGATQRISNEKTATFKCKGTVLNDWDDNIENATPMYIGAITADEIIYAGAKYSMYDNYSYYLINDEFKKGSNGIYSDAFWSITPHDVGTGNDSAWYVFSNGDTNNGGWISTDMHFRPMIILKNNTLKSSGDGTIESPYVINMSS